MYSVSQYKEHKQAYLLVSIVTALYKAMNLCCSWVHSCEFLQFYMSNTRKILFFSYFVPHSYDVTKYYHTLDIFVFKPTLGPFLCY